MRKLILISALLLASASAQAGESRGLVLAAADTPQATTTDAVRQPLPPVAKTEDAKPQATETARPLPSSKPRSQARRFESDEAKARRIAARYGISW
jgi:hypothetical protein